MPRFNTPTLSRSTKTVNLAGGEAFQQTNKLEIVSILLTSFVKDQYYRAADDTMARLKMLVHGITDQRFLAQAALYARHEYGMRSISHVLAAEIAATVKNQTWTRRFFKAIIHRPDDITEILAFYLAAYGKPIPNALKKGLGAALSSLDAYQLAKYRGGGGGLSLVDAINLCHPKHTEALASLVNGTLAPANTWEARLSASGNEENIEEAKAAVWADLIKTQKLGYFALLRNLRNIYQQAPEALDDALAMLVDPDRIAKSLVMPFRYLSALDEIDKLPGVPRKIGTALNQALDLATSNVPRFDGTTCVILDESGSMRGQPIRIGSLFAAILAKSNDADIVMFSNEARYVPYQTLDTTTTIAEKLSRSAVMQSTDFSAPFRILNKRYDRLIWISDMQGWIGFNVPVGALDKYSNTYAVRPHVYSFDLAGYGTMQFPQDRLYCIAGFSEKVFDVMELLEEDRHALIHRIEQVTF